MQVRCRHGRVGHEDGRGVGGGRGGRGGGEEGRVGWAMGAGIGGWADGAGAEWCGGDCAGAGCPGIPWRATGDGVQLGLGVRDIRGGGYQ